MATEIVRYPTNYQVIQRATENSLDEAKNSRTIEVTPVEPKPKTKTPRLWDRMSERRKNFCIYGTLIGILILGVCVVIVCGTLLGTQIPYGNSGSNAGKVVGLTIGIVMILASIVLLLLIYCRRPKHFQRAMIRQPPQKQPVQLIKREMQPSNPKQIIHVVRQEPAPAQRLVARQAPVLVQTTVQQPNTRPFNVVSDQATHYIVTSPKR